MIPGNYKSDKLVNITGIDEIHLKCDCIDGSIVNVVHESILYSVRIYKPPSQNLYKNLDSIFLRKVSKSVLSLMKLYLEDDFF